MALKNSGPVGLPADPFRKDSECPKCGAEMEQIEVALEELPIQQLQLCPKCYVVTWRDDGGLHAQQGFPVKKGHGPLAGPQEC
jgi:hypothetical protein